MLVVDEVGYLTYGTDAANMLFHVVNERHRRQRAMIFTTNKSLKAWGRVLHDEDLAQAIIDRVLERGRLLRLDGPSIRTLHVNLDEAMKEESDQDRRRGQNFRKSAGQNFRNPQAVVIDHASDIRAYIAKRIADTYLARPARRIRHRNGTLQELPEVRRPVSAGEINRELTVLKRMFSLAIEAGKLHHKPHFAMLREDNVRVGFFEREQYQTVLAHLPDGMRPVVTFALRHGLADQQRGAAAPVAAGRPPRRARSGSIQAPPRIERVGCST